MCITAIPNLRIQSFLLIISRTNLITKYSVQTILPQKNTSRY